MAANNQMAVQAIEQSRLSDGQAELLNDSNSVGKLRESSNGIPARVAEINGTKLPAVSLESAFKPSNARVSHSNYRDDENIGASNPDKQNKYKDDDEDDDNKIVDLPDMPRIYSLAMAVPILGRLLSFLPGLQGLRNNSSSDCNNGGCCQRRMSTRVDGLRSNSSSNSYNMILGLPGYNQRR